MQQRPDYFVGFLFSNIGHVSADFDVRIDVTYQGMGRLSDFSQGFFCCNNKLMVNVKYAGKYAEIEDLVFKWDDLLFRECTPDKTIGQLWE